MFPRSITACFLVVLGAGCATTTFETTWRAPDVGPIDYAGKRIAAIFVSAEESTRRVAEDALARELTAHGAQGVAAYTLIPIEDLKDSAGARAKLGAAGCAGVVMMRVTAHEQRIASYPGWYSGAQYCSFSGYSRWGWGTVYEPGYLTTETIVWVETLVYGLERDTLLWAGTSKAFEPSNIEEFVVELATAAASQMKKEGLIR